MLLSDGSSGQSYQILVSHSQTYLPFIWRGGGSGYARLIKSCIVSNDCWQLEEGVEEGRMAGTKLQVSTLISLSPPLPRYI